MRFGLCGKGEDWEAAERLGFDYLELPVNWLEGLDDQVFGALLEEGKKRSIKVERCNLLFPKNLLLVGPEKAGEAAVVSYARHAFSRMRKLNADLAVFGSGKSRNFPAGLSYGEGMEELLKVTRLVADVAREYGITIALEELNRNESNCLTSLTECALFAAWVGRDNVSVLADMYHMVSEQEPLTDISLVGRLSHAHIAVRGTRGYPTVKDADLELFFQQLGSIGYEGTLSIEGKTADRELDAPSALSVMRGYCHE